MREMMWSGLVEFLHTLVGFSINGTGRVFDHTGSLVLTLVEFLHTLVGFSITDLVLTLVEFLHTLVGFSGIGTQT